MIFTPNLLMTNVVFFRESLPVCQIPAGGCGLTGGGRGLTGGGCGLPVNDDSVLQLTNHKTTHESTRHLCSNILKTNMSRLNNSHLCFLLFPHRNTWSNTWKKTNVH